MMAKIRFFTLPPCSSRPDGTRVRLTRDSCDL